MIPATPPTPSVWQFIGSIAVPTSSVDGPAKVVGGIGSCFAHSPTGALFALMNAVALTEVPNDQVSAVAVVEQRGSRSGAYAQAMEEAEQEDSSSSMPSDPSTAPKVTVDSTLVGQVIVALLSFGAIVYAKRATQRTAQQTVDAGAYERARKIDESAFGRLQAEIRGLLEQLAQLRGELEAEQSAHSEAGRQNSRLLARVADLERTVERMSRLLASAGLELPPSLDPRLGGDLDPGKGTP